MPVLNPQALIDNRVAEIIAFHNGAGTRVAEIDVSGGLDSAVLVGLLAGARDAGGLDNIVAVHSQINSNPDALERAREVCEVFGVKLIEIDLTAMYENLVDTMLECIVMAYGSDEPTIRVRLHGQALADPTILGSIRSCIRAPIGRGFNRLLGGGIRHGTGNECEDRWARFYQKGGDGEVDTNPIAMLSKAETFQLALKLGVPRSIITATPSPDLWGEGDGHNDEDEFATYFGFKPEGHTFYGYIDAETGEYTRVGLIERVSRFLDLTFMDSNDYDRPRDLNMGSWLFRDGDYPDWDRIIALALGQEVQYIPFRGQDTFFDGIDPDLVKNLLQAARRVERATRHKYNPNCPTLGTRAELVEAHILTNELPTL